MKKKKEYKPKHNQMKTTAEEFYRAAHYPDYSDDQWAEERESHTALFETMQQYAYRSLRSYVEENQLLKKQVETLNKSVDSWVEISTMDQNEITRLTKRIETLYYCIGRLTSEKDSLTEELKDLLKKTANNPSFTTLDGIQEAPKWIPPVVPYLTATDNEG